MIVEKNFDSNIKQKKTLLFRFLNKKTLWKIHLKQGFEKRIGKHVDDSPKRICVMEV